MTDNRRGALEMALAMTISGTIGWFVLMAGRPPLDVVFWRCVFGALALGLYCLATGAFRVRMSWRQAALAVFGGVAIVVNWLMLFAAYRHASVAVATAVYNVQPFIVLAFGALMFGERITLAKVGWIALAFVGVVLIVMEKPSASYVGADFGLGIALTLAASVGWAIATITTKKLAGVPPQKIAFIHVVTGIVILAPFAELSTLPSGAMSWSMLVALGFLHTGIMYALMYSAVQKLPTYLQGALTFINPVVAVLTDVFALGHVLHPSQIAGIAVILTAAAGTTFLPGVMARVRAARRERMA